MASFISSASDLLALLKESAVLPVLSCGYKLTRSTVAFSAGEFVAMKSNYQVPRAAPCCSASLILSMLSTVSSRLPPSSSRNSSQDARARTLFGICLLSISPGNPSNVTVLPRREIAVVDAHLRK